MQYRRYSVSSRSKEPLLSFILEALRDAGCRIIRHTEPKEAPFRISFETIDGERMGILCYAFLANSKTTKNRPDDEHRFQVKYGPNVGGLHDFYQDPYGLYTTLFCGIDPKLGLFVGADPVLHSPTKQFISLEFKREQADAIIREGWHAWERDRRAGAEEPVEVFVGGQKSRFLDFVRFERIACGLDQGNRQLLAEKILAGSPVVSGPVDLSGSQKPNLYTHELAHEFDMEDTKILDLIATARRLKMAVRGWVAEEHLVKTLIRVPGVSECQRLDEEGGPDVSLRFEESRPLTIQCKNVLRKMTADNRIRLDFQKTRASKSDPCSRYYRVEEFDLIAACLHAVTESWEFSYAIPGSLDVHSKCPGRVSQNVKIDPRWSKDATAMLRRAAA